MQGNTGPNEKSLRIASLVMQESFVETWNQLDRIQLRSSIDSFLSQERSIPLILRLFVNVLKMRFVPLGFSKTILLRMLRARSSKLLQYTPQSRSEKRRIKHALKPTKTGSK